MSVGIIWIIMKVLAFVLGLINFVNAILIQKNLNISEEKRRSSIRNQYSSPFIEMRKKVILVHLVIYFVMVVAIEIPLSSLSNLHSDNSDLPLIGRSSAH